jgi:Uncharacterized conserved protein
LFLKNELAQKELAKKLRSTNYLVTLSEWELFLKQQALITPTEPNARLSIKQLADRRISKNYKLILKEGSAINENSPSEALHDLRKSCKKLRYLMEFFQSLYLESQINHFIKNLKKLQEVLGDYQDYAVQEQTLREYSEEMLNNNVDANTLLAMGVLIQNLDSFKDRARQAFSSKFETFKHEENQSAFDTLLAAKT